MRSRNLHFYAYVHRQVRLIRNIEDACNLQQLSNSCRASAVTTNFVAKKNGFSIMIEVRSKKYCVTEFETLGLVSFFGIVQVFVIKVRNMVFLKKPQFRQEPKIRLNTTLNRNSTTTGFCNQDYASLVSTGKHFMGCSDHFYAHGVA